MTSRMGLTRAGRFDAPCRIPVPGMGRRVDPLVTGGTALKVPPRVMDEGNMKI
jgi:hypothetical protein